MELKKCLSNFRSGTLEFVEGRTSFRSGYSIRKASACREDDQGARHFGIFSYIVLTYFRFAATEHEIIQDQRRNYCDVSPFSPKSATGDRLNHGTKDMLSEQQHGAPKKCSARERIEMTSASAV
ncbi:uncharacterized protein LOC116257706 [Nymphaea colorata]|nr:uncharacterized protein LOC116257706 [Nymphaea colorata]XP_031490522.1 uncharacterized protein LOC116257706 [Nymphaea colorata]